MVMVKDHLSGDCRSNGPMIGDGDGGDGDGDGDGIDPN